MMLAADYVHRFGKSIYARKLFRDLSAAVAERTDMDNAAVITSLLGAVEGTDQQVSTKLLLDLSGEALLRGRLVLAKTAASEALKLGKGSAEDLEKARLYEAAADAPSGRATDALKVLDQIAADRLSDEDTEIRAVAGYIARVVAGGEPSGMAQAGPTGTPTPSQRGVVATVAEEPKVASALESADAILKQADLLIQGKAK
jgi:chemotaxis protein MotC